VTKEIGIRLSLKDKELVERGLKSLGTEGQGALRKIEVAARPASAGLLAVSSAASAGRSAFFGMASGAIAAVASYLSLSAAINGTRDALDMMSEIADRSKSTGLDVELLQEVTHHAELAGVSYDELSGSLETFIRNAGLAEVGKGKMVAALKALNPELLRNIQLATTQEERLRLAADAINEAGSASEKAAISTALFGANGARMVEVFNGGAAALDATAAKARELGIIIDRELIARADELGDEFDTAAKVIDINLKSALVNLAPTIVWLVERAGDLARAFNIVIDQFKDVEDRTFVRPLQNQLADLYNRRAALGQDIQTTRDEATPGMEFANKVMLAEKQAEFDRMTAEADRLLSRITELQGRGDTPEVVPPTVDIPDLPPSEGARRAINDAEKLIERLRTAAEDYQAQVQKLDGMLSSGLISQDSYNRAVGKAALTFAGAAEGASEYEAAQAALDKALQQGMLTEADYTKAVEAMTARRLAASTDWASGVERGLRRLANEGKDIGKSVEDSLVNAAGSFEEALVSAFETGKFEWDDLSRSIMADLLRMGVRQGIAGLSSLIGSAFNGGGFGGGGLQLGYQRGVPSFDGGGWTGSGPRMGGLDGKGGYLAMVHPQETILDSTRGGAAAASVVVQHRTEVHNYGNDQVRTEQARGADGVDVTKVIIGAVNSGIAEGRFDGTLKGVYGLTRKGH
jgi:hypothetical protein